MTRLINCGFAALLICSASNAEGQAAPAAAFGRPHPVLPKGNPGAWFSVKDYPKAARRAGVSGRVKFAAVVDSRGRVEKCTIVDSSGNADLDARTCQLLKRRGRFIPAINEQGRAIAGQFSQAVNWQTRAVDHSTGRDAMTQER
jgi:protein TonB